MKAVVYKGPKNVEIEEVGNPKIERPTDVIVRVTSSAISRRICIQWRNNNGI